MSLALGLAGVAQASDAAGQSVSRALFGVAHLIAECARNIKVNKASALRLARRVDEFVTVITTELEQRQNDDLSDEWLQALAHFQDILGDVYEHVRKQENRSYLSQILHQERDSEALDNLLNRAQVAFDALMVGAHMKIHKLLDAVNESLETSYAMDELMTQRSSINRPSINRPTSPDGDFVPQIPPPPYNFFGRDQEVNAIATTLVGNAGGQYVAILGGPGIGKTSLALSALHNPAVISHFGGARYFVPCDAVGGKASCIQIVSFAFGLCSSSSAALKKRLAAMSNGGPTLLILDNFESAWEAPELRQEAEQLLQVLCEVPLCSIIITLRGTERPLGISWTRPFLPPLQPLRTDAALMTFVTISDREESDVHLGELMGFTENVPLALVLMANLAQYESTKALVSRWNELSTSMLKRGDGRNRLNSLDASITLSLQSHRVSSSPDAAKLLSLLSLLPSGVMDTDLVTWAHGIDANRAVSTLIQTALAYRTSERRIRVLAPIRSFSLTQIPPTDATGRGLFDHYFGLAELVFTAGVDTSGFEAVASIGPEIENMQSVVRYALSHSPDPRPAVRAAVCMCRLYNDTGMGTPSLMTEALAIARRENMDDQTAALLHQWALMACNTPMPGDPAALFAESRDLHERLGNIDGVIDLTLHLTWYCTPREALATCQQMRDLAASRGDKWRVSRCDQALARVYERMGDRQTGREYLAAAVATLQADFPNEHRQLGWCIFRLGDIALDCGESALGIEKIRESIPILRRSGFLLGLATAEYLLGDALLTQGYTSSAIPYLEAGLRSCRIGGLARREINCLIGLANGHIAMGNHAEAEQFLNAADDLTRGAGNAWTMNLCNIMEMRSRLQLSLGDTAGARALLYGARMTSRVTDPSHSAEDMEHVDAVVLHQLGRVAKAEGQLDDAQIWFIASAIANRGVGLNNTTLRVLCSLAQVVDDDLSQVLMEAIFAPLLRLNFRTYLGDLLFHSAAIAKRTNQPTLARHRAGSALKHYEEAGFKPKSDSVREFLRESI